jgi:hypothetical protein
VAQPFTSRPCAVAVHFIDYMFVGFSNLCVEGFVTFAIMDRGEEWLFECRVDLYLLNEYTEYIDVVN